MAKENESGLDASMFEYRLRQLINEEMGLMEAAIAGKKLSEEALVKHTNAVLESLARDTASVALTSTHFFMRVFEKSIPEDLSEFGHGALGRSVLNHYVENARSHLGLHLAHITPEKWKVK